MVDPPTAAASASRVSDRLCCGLASAKRCPDMITTHNYAALRFSLRWTNASRSELTRSLWVVHRPCGAPS